MGYLELHELAAKQNEQPGESLALFHFTGRHVHLIEMKPTPSPSTWWTQNKKLWFAALDNVSHEGPIGLFAKIPTCAQIG